MEAIQITAIRIGDYTFTNYQNKQYYFFNSDFSSCYSCEEMREVFGLNGVQLNEMIMILEGTK